MTSRIIICEGKQPPPCKHDLSRMDPWWRERHNCASQDAFDAEQTRLAALARAGADADPASDRSTPEASDG